MITPIHERLPAEGASSGQDSIPGREHPGSKRLLALSAEELTRPEFIETRIRPLLESRHPRTTQACDATIVRNTGTGRLTIRYTFGPDIVLFGKLYDDDLGRRCHRVTQALWDNGFHNEGCYRVPQPLAYYADRRLFLMLSVQGTSLGAYFGGDASIDLDAGCRAAAEWLAVLHLSALRIGSPETGASALRQLWEENRVIKAISGRPEIRNMIRSVVQMLDQHVALLKNDGDCVLTHGRFNHDHVFLGGAATSVVDLDRCRPSDPAKDVAEFLLSLRLSAFIAGLPAQAIEAAVSAFLSSYLAQVPHAIEHLGCFWAAFAFQRLLRGLGQCTNNSAAGSAHLTEWHLKEIHTALDSYR